MTRPGTHRAIGVLTVVSAGLYLLSDAMEALSGGFSSAQLMVAYAAMALQPFSVMGLSAAYADEAPSRYAWVSLMGAFLYGLSFVFFAGTALYGLVHGTVDYGRLVAELGPAYWAHGGMMVIGGLLLGGAVTKRPVETFPRWSGVLLLAATVIAVLIPLVGAPAEVDWVSNSLRNLGFVGAGLATIKSAGA